MLQRPVSSRNYRSLARLTVTSIRRCRVAPTSDAWTTSSPITLTPPYYRYSSIQNYVPVVKTPQQSVICNNGSIITSQLLTSALDGGEWSASRPGRFTPRESPPGTHWIGGWVGSGAVLDAVVKRKIPSPRRESNPRIPIVQPVAQRYADWAIRCLDVRITLIYIQKMGW
jgi:hypothetical protein